MRRANPALGSEPRSARTPRPPSSGAALASTAATQGPGRAGTLAEDSGERLVSAGSWREVEALLL